MRLSRRQFISAAGAVGVTLGGSAMLSGCSIPLNPSFVMRKSTGKAVGVSGGRLQFPVRMPYGFDPFFVKEASGIQIANLLFDPLVRYDYREKKIVPAAAQSWTVSNDGKTFQFRIAGKMKFHNGEDVTAADFKYSWQRLFKKTAFSDISTNVSFLSTVQGAKAMLAGEAEEISGIIVRGTKTLEVALEYPFYEFLQLLSFPGLAPVPMSAVEGSEEQFYYKPIGNGPFMLSDMWTFDSDRLSLTRFEDYHKEPAFLKYVDLMFYADSNDAKQEESDMSFQAFETGDIDVARIPASKLTEAKDMYGESIDGYTGALGQQVITGNKAVTYYLQPNTLSEFLSDPRVRRAISLAINRKAICSELFLDTYIPATGLVPSVIDGVKDNAWPDTEYNPTRAKLLLNEFMANKDPEINKITLLAANSDVEEELFKLIREDLSIVGFNVVTRAISSNADLEATKDQATLRYTGWIADYPSMDNFLEPILTKNGAANSTGYNNPIFDQAIIGSRGVQYESPRLVAYQYADNLAAAEMPVIPLFCPTLDMVCSERVNDLFIAFDGTADLTKVWVTI